MATRITVDGIQDTLRMVEDEFEKEAEKILREAAEAAFAEMRRNTPVDTGRAQNSWRIGYSPDLVNTLSPGRETLSPRNRPRDIYLANGTDHIEALNDGHSRQAPSRFVEQAIAATLPGDSIIS